MSLFTKEMAKAYVDICTNPKSFQLNQYSKMIRKDKFEFSDWSIEFDNDSLEAILMNSRGVRVLKIKTNDLARCVMINKETLDGKDGDS